MLETIMGLVPFLAGHLGLLAPAGGLVSAAISYFTPAGWVKYALIGVAAVLIAGWIGALKLHIAHQDTALALKDAQIARIEGEGKLAVQQRLFAEGERDRWKQQLDAVTILADKAEKRAASADAQLEQSTKANDARTQRIIADARKAATLDDRAPVPPGVRTLLIELLRPPNGAADKPGAGLYRAPAGRAPQAERRAEAALR